MTCNKPQTDSRQTQSLSPQEPKKGVINFDVLPFDSPEQLNFTLSKRTLSHMKKKNIRNPILIWGHLSIGGWNTKIHSISINITQSSNHHPVEAQIIGQSTQFVN